VPAEDQRFPTPCGPSTDQGDDLSPRGRFIVVHLKSFAV
jgi:hypothetical protein